MVNLDKVETRWPCVGEELVLHPLEAAVGWYLVHRIGADVFPCLEDGCPMCQRKARGRTAKWEGYILCELLHEPGKMLVARLLPGLYNCCPALQNEELDLCWQCWRYSRWEGRGLPRLCLMTTEPDSIEVVPGPLRPDHWQHLMSFWSLPENVPDYRQRVYFEVLPRRRPEVNSPYNRLASLYKENGGAV